MVVLNAKMISFTSPSATRRTRLSIRKSLGPIPSIGEMIPPELYEVVAEILVFVDAVDHRMVKESVANGGKHKG